MKMILRVVVRGRYQEVVGQFFGAISKHLFGFWIIVGLHVCCSIFAQGHLHFANRVQGYVDAPVTFLDGTPVGPEYTAQMYGGIVGTPLSSLKPLSPTTTFRSGLGRGYVIGIGLVVPDVNEFGTFVMRVFDGTSWETSLCRGESKPVTIKLTHPPGPPADLIGLEPFQVNCIPEPSTIVLGIAGAITVLLWRKRQ